MRLRSALLLILLASLTGCASLESQLPVGRADKVRYVRTGKFSSTTIEAEGFEKTPERITAERWKVIHSNAWIPHLEITAERYERQIAK